MEVLSYSPSVEVYAALVRDGVESYLDLTEDVVSVQVGRNQNAPSTFTVRLQNKGRKYNDMFMPFDRVKVYATKIERHPLITGYVTSLPSYQLYGADLTISGSCSLYRLQSLYWDSGLYDSQKLLGYQKHAKSWDEVIVNLLTQIAGYSEGQIIIGQMPADIIDWAYGLWDANVNDRTQARSMIDDFYKMLATSGPSISTVSPTTTGVVSGSIPRSAGGGYSLLGDGIDFTMSREKFVNLWGPRIDRYIERVIGSSSPVYGYGKIYADAAWVGKMDPRWLPVIGFFETGLGTASSYAGYPYNLYGYGCTDTGETGVARSQPSYETFIHFILDNAGTRANGWGGEKVLNEYTDLAELDDTYCSSSAERISDLRDHMLSI